MEHPIGDLTRRLLATPNDEQARGEFFSAVYQELLKLARAELVRHRRGVTLDTRVLVSEAYLRLCPEGGLFSFENRKHFFGAAARAMRHVVIDYARRRLAARRGGGAANLDIDASVIAVESQAEQLVAMDAALTRLAERDPRLAELVELRFFAGLSVEQLAETMQVSTATIKRDTRLARAFISRELGHVV